MFWIVARNVQKKSFEYFKIFLKNLFGNSSECSIRTFQNVPEHSKKVSEQVCKHFEVSSEKIFENNSQCSG